MWLYWLGVVALIAPIILWIVALVMLATGEPVNPALLIRLGFVTIACWGYGLWEIRRPHKKSPDTKKNE